MESKHKAIVLGAAWIATGAASVVLQDFTPLAFALAATLIMFING